MREILFRGKRCNKEWIYGSLLKVTYDGHTYNLIFADNFLFVFGEATAMEHASVNPSTVGQFAGLTDKNGTKIFEGDILKIAKQSDGTGMYYFPPLDYPVNVVVKWDMCAWMWETLCEDKRYIGFPEAWCHYVCEVIGNIHDNPELLEG